ncbi:MAG: hypothetical protein AB8I08_20740 [Sandaracinaceae bacterium]
MRRTVSNQVLSGLIAFGSCGFVACDDPGEPPVQPSMPPMAVNAPTPDPEIGDEPAATVPEEPATDSDTSQLGTLELQPGFTPDPLSRVGTAEGGPIDAHLWDDRCDGWIAEHPDAQVDVVRPFAELAIMAASDADTTLVVVGPDGEARCSNDEEGHDPLLRAAVEPGTHRIWVGTAEPGEPARFVLSFSEFDATLPAETL